MSNSVSFAPSVPSALRPSRKPSLLQRKPSLIGVYRPPVAQAAPVRFADIFAEPNADTVLTPDNNRISLISHVQSYTNSHVPVLVGWLRHYGCTLCKKQAADWSALQPRLADCGPLQMVLVGNGTPSQAVDFIEEMGWKGDMFTDPERKTYAALGFRKNLGATFTRNALKRVIVSLKAHKQTWRRLPTDAFQQGGAVLVNGKGEVSLFHADTFAGDHVDVDKLYDKVCEACKAAATV